MNKSTREMSKAWQICFIAILRAAYVLVPDFAWAYTGGGTTSPVGAAICFAAESFAGEVAAGVATVAVCTIGTLACVGRIQWTTALIVAVGLSVIFGSGPIILMFQGGDAGCSSLREAPSLPVSPS
jgi:type IV secretory pathway VirB2 component (pilin)